MKAGDTPTVAEIAHPTCAGIARRRKHQTGRPKWGMVGLLLPDITLEIAFIGVFRFLLPQQIESLQRPDKVQDLALINGISALFATIANPILGAMSDRTRSPWGRRAPWLIGSSLATLGCMATLGCLHSFTALLVGFCVLQVTINGCLAAASALLPERVPEEHRGKLSALVQFVAPVAYLATGLIVGQESAPMPMRYIAIGSTLFIGCTSFALLNRERSSDAIGLRSLRLATMFSGLTDHDFRWIFVSFLLLSCAESSFTNFRLYLLQDYIRIEKTGATDAMILFSTIEVISTSATVLAFGALSDYLRRRKIFVMGGTLGMAAALMAPVIWPTYPGMLLFSVIHGIANGCYEASGSALASKVLPDSNHIARDLGILNIATAAPQIVMPLLAATIIARSGGYRSLLIDASVITALSGLAILRLRAK